MSPLYTSLKKKNNKNKSETTQQMNGITQRVSTGTGQTVMGDILRYNLEGHRL